MANIVRGDNTAAFGGNFLTISLSSSGDIPVVVTKAVFACGSIKIEFENPQFPLKVNLTEEQTATLSCENTCYLAVWDEEGRKLTCEGSLAFKTTPRKV